MTTVTEAALRDIKDLVTGLSQRMETRFNELDKKIDAVDKKLDIHIAKIDEHFKGIEKRLDDTNTRINTITFGIFSVVGVFAAGILTIMAKIVFFPNP